MKIITSNITYIILNILMPGLFGLTQAQVTNTRTGHSYSTIQAGIADGSTTSGDLLQIGAGTFAENVTVNKSIILMGSGSGTMITPPSGIGITISAGNVQIYDLKITGASRFGIYANGAASLTLSGVVCTADSVGAELDNVSGVTVNGCTFSNNNNYGFYSDHGQSFSVAGCTANGNGTTIATGSGMKFHGCTGSSTLTSITADNNHSHGVELGGTATSNITINGGVFNGNGTSNLFDGGGIYIFARSATVSNIVINGPLTANNNITCGIYADANTSASDLISGLTIGQSGTASFSSNGTSEGAGVLLFGHISGVTITGNFSKGSVSNSAGVIVVGQNISGANSPANVTIANSTFQAGYTSTTPAIALADGQPTHNFICTNNVTATGNTFLGLSTLADIPNVIYDKSDDATLGQVILSSNVLPVEMVSFTAEAAGQGVHLQWSTATEVNNYGFEVERRGVEPMSLRANESLNQISSVSTTQTLNGSNAQWLTIGFVQGNGTSNIQHAYSYMDGAVSSGTYAYRLKQIDNGGSFKYSFETQVTLTVPTTLALYQNYPNPFNPATTIEFTIPATERVSLLLFNELGQQIRTIFSGEAEGGVLHRIIVDASGLSSGLYFYQLNFGYEKVIKKMILLK